MEEYQKILMVSRLYMSASTLVEKQLKWGIEPSALWKVRTVLFASTFIFKRKLPVPDIFQNKIQDLFAKKALCLEKFFFGRSAKDLLEHYLSRGSWSI